MTTCTLPPPAQPPARLPPPVLALVQAHASAACRYSGRGSWGGFVAFRRQLLRLCDDPRAADAARYELARRIGAVAEGRGQ